MAPDKAVAALQRQAAEAEVERLRLVGELEEMRLRAAAAESMLASVSGVTRLELVAAAKAEVKAEAVAIVERHIYEEDTEPRSILASLKAMAVSP